MPKGIGYGKKDKSVSGNPIIGAMTGDPVEAFRKNREDAKAAKSSPKKTENGVSKAIKEMGDSRPKFPKGAEVEESRPKRFMDGNRSAEEKAYLKGRPKDGLVETKDGFEHYDDQNRSKMPTSMMTRKEMADELRAKKGKVSDDEYGKMKAKYHADPRFDPDSTPSQARFRQARKSAQKK